jgi:uncharacterized membrane protein
MTTRWRPITAVVVSLLGLAIATYLTYEHYATPTGAPGTCLFGGSGNSVINCGAVTTSAESMIFGLPVALYGAVFFVFMTVINLPVLWRSTSVWVARLRLAASIAGIGMVIYLISVETLVVHHICIWCTGVHILMFALFVLITTGWQETGWAASQWSDEEIESDYAPA